MGGGDRIDGQGKKRERKRKCVQERDICSAGMCVRTCTDSCLRFRPQPKVVRAGQT